MTDCGVSCNHVDRRRERSPSTLEYKHELYALLCMVLLLCDKSQHLINSDEFLAILTHFRLHQFLFFLMAPKKVINKIATYITAGPGSRTSNETRIAVGYIDKAIFPFAENLKLVLAEQAPISIPSKDIVIYKVLLIIKNLI